MSNEDPSSASFTEDFAWLAALFSATLLNIFHRMGTSPVAWTDSFVDQRFVANCLRDNLCTTVGARASVSVFHTSGYLHWLSLMKWLGFGVDAVYAVLLGLNALAVVLTALAARRVGGRIAGALAGLIMLASIGVGTQLNAVTDVVPLPFHGALFLLLGLSAAARPSWTMTVMLGVLAGVAGGTYATCMLLGVAAVWISWRAQRSKQQREDHAFLAAACFAATGLIIAPGSWLVNAQLLLSPGHLGAGAKFVPPVLLHAPLAVLSGSAFLVWIASLFFPLGRRLEVPAAVLLPLLAPAAILIAAGKLSLQGKYFAHVLAAAAVILAVSAAAAARGVGSLARRFFPSLAVSAPAAAILERLAPYAAACAIALLPLRDRGVEAAAAGFRMPSSPMRYSDLAAFERVLARERGWAWSKAYRNLKILDAQLNPGVLRWAPGWPDAGATGDLERVYAVKVPARFIPQPLPSGAVIASSDGPDATLLVPACSWIDWRSFRVCVKRRDDVQETCRPGGLEPWDMFSDASRAPVPGMPDFGDQKPQTLRLHLPLKPRPDCPREMIYMPRAPLLCQGRIAAVDGAARGVDASGRAAILDLRAAHRELVLEWELDVQKCGNVYGGYPPFFVEGAPETVSLLKNILEPSGP